MEIIRELLEEHDLIERELLELETIINEEEINYSNLIHTCKKLHQLWEEHEIKEEKFFPELSNKGFRIPVTILHFDHVALKSHKQKLYLAIKSGNNFAVQKALHIDLEIIIAKLRAHIKKEETILYTIPENLLS